MEKEKNKKKKEFKICGYSLWRIFAYFILYSVIGYLIETVFGVLTKGVLESRKGFLYGPFCPIYGLGGVCMVLSLKRFNKISYHLFFVGTIVGGAVEYLISFIGELVFKVKWWDYSNEILNINGRICLAYCFMWGFLAIYLMKRLHPRVNAIILWAKKKLNNDGMKIAIISITLLLFIDGVLTCFGLKVYYSRMVHDYNLKVKNYTEYIQDYKEIANNELVFNITNKMFSNHFMLLTFPNLTMQAEDGSIIYIKDILKDMKPYYLKLFTPKQIKLYEISWI